MTALAADRNTQEYLGDMRQVPVAAGAVIWAGALVVINATGYAEPGATATGKAAIGRAEAPVDNTGGGNGDLAVKVKSGVFRFVNDGGDAVDLSHVESIAYIVDDQTVASNDGGATRSAAGKVIDVDSNGVWVLTGSVEGPLSGSLLAANNLSDVASKATARTNLGVYERLGTPVFVIGAEASDVINVGIQLKDSAGADLAVRGEILAYLSDDANGDTIAGTAPSGGVAIGTDGLVIPLVAGKAFTLVSEADGDIDIDITEVGVDTWYLVLIMPDGRLVASGAITFA